MRVLVHTSKFIPKRSTNAMGRLKPAYIWKRVLMSSLETPCFVSVTTSSMLIRKGHTSYWDIYLRSSAVKTNKGRLIPMYIPVLKLAAWCAYNIHRLIKHDSRLQRMRELLFVANLECEASPCPFFCLLLQNNPQTISANWFFSQIWENRMRNMYLCLSN
jgi:hypothetical protein